MAEQDAERTEDPTPRRRAEALREGNVPRSTELTAAAGLIVACGVLLSQTGAALGEALRRILVQAWGGLAGPPLSIEATQRLAIEVLGAAALAALPVLGLIAVGTAAVGLAQARGVIAVDALQPKLDRLSISQGLKRLLGVEGLFAALKAVAKFLLIGAVAWSVIAGAWPALMRLAAADVPEVARVMQGLSGRLLLTGGLTFLAVALVDYGFQVWRYEQGLKMTKQEVQQEGKDLEGNPQVKARLRSLREAMARKRMLTAVKTADVVVTNPTHIAIALRYRAGKDAAPVVIAMGERKLAERIKAIARAAGVETVENKPLARALLATAKVGRVIPVELFEAVAEVLAFVYRRRGWRPA
ncbi:MAG: EscU/YscU/HrcU family type III secretion system export apparatus switch protein [Gemmatimonadales bacterium]|nr:EscU/YscU/HrcU family type III secretion system export apparatus switch protein [Gemmatimonadales bacterium]